MTGIWDFDDLDELEKYLLDISDQARLQMNEAGTPLPPQFSIQEIFIIGDWGDGIAEIGETPLEIEIIVSFRNEISELGAELRNEVLDIFGEFANTIENTAQNISPPPENIREWFTDEIQVTITDQSQKQEQLINIMGSVVQNTIVNLTERRVIRFEAGRSFEQFERILIERFEEEDDDETDGVQLFEDDEEEIEEDEEEEEEEPEPEFPKNDETLNRFKVDDKLEIPAGKETKEIEARTPYDFEIEMASPNRQTSSEIRELAPFEFAQTEASDLREDLLDLDFVYFGESVRTGQFGRAHPPGTFPRTGVYVRNRLTYQGVGYLYEIYKDLIYYSGLISSVYQTIAELDPDSFLTEPLFKTGRYESFREFIFVLDEISKQDEGPVLIERLSQQQAAARGLSVIPEHGATGEPAPWLENRQYIDIVEESSEHPAWMNPYDFLYPDEDDEENGEEEQQAEANNN